MPATILLTGGAGFIGSHTYVALSNAGFRVVIADDFSNAARDVPDRLSMITGHPVIAYDVDVCEPRALSAVFEAHRIDAVVHFAAKKSVPQSLAQPERFFTSNIAALLNVMRMMQAFGVHKIVYSSSATVYGAPEALPIPEHAPLSYTNPYGLSKLMGEQYLTQRIGGTQPWDVGILRYFNPAGAHSSGLIGEAPLSNGGNLMPLVAQVAKGQLPQLTIFGGDYGTHDGTGIRDYIHVCDLAEGHLRSLALLLEEGRSHTVNLGKGQGYSVLDVIKTYERVSGRRIPIRFQPRRAGDVAASFADARMAQTVLGFEARRDLTEMCRSSWCWETGKKSEDRAPLLPSSLPGFPRGVDPFSLRH